MTLKPCWKCGGRAVLAIDAMNENGFSFSVKCEQCGQKASNETYIVIYKSVPGNEEIKLIDDRDRAAEEWNAKCAEEGDTDDV